MLIDTGSSSDIMFASAFEQLRISRDRLRPVTTPLVGFNGSSTQPLGMIELPILMGTHPQQTSVITRFVVVEASSAYNVILGRPTLNQARAVVSTYSLVVKFPTPQGIGILKGGPSCGPKLLCYLPAQECRSRGIGGGRDGPERG